MHEEAAGSSRGGFAADSRFDNALDEPKPLAGSASSRWMGWRLRLLVALSLLGCLCIMAMVASVAGWPVIDATWRDAAGKVELASSANADLQALRGHTLAAIGGAANTKAAPTVAIDASALQRSMRWLIDDDERAHLVVLHRQLAALLDAPQVSLSFSDGTVHVATPQRSGLARLPVLFWLLSTLVLGLYLVAMVVVLAQPSVRNLLYAVMACCQAGNLVFVAIEMAFELGQPALFTQFDMPVRATLDLVTAAAIVHAASLHPRRLPGWGWISMGAWGAALLLTALVVSGVAGAWWWVQGGVAGLGLAAIGLLSWSYRIEPHPVAIMLRRFGVIAVGTWMLLTVAVAATPHLTDMPQSIAAIGSMVWYVFLGSLLMLVPFLAKSHLVMREFSLLAAISTIATALDLLFVAVFSLGQFASLTLSLFISLAVYSGIRQWVMTQLLGTGMLTTERMFEQLYRIAREVELHPERTPALLSMLLRQLFEPMEARIVDRESTSTRIAGDGSTLLVPVPHLTGEIDPTRTSIIMRFAQRGRRLFTPDDARLTDRIVEQLRRAVAFDQAVEQGRKEERLRIAQDLHDDIGARLLTLMYKAQSPEMEDYLRHTLQDLKTLTRGLAASNHRLSHSAAEWKADLTARLTAAQIELKWSVNFDDDVLLTVVHWSAITRVLRELVSNAIAHAQAEKVAIEMGLHKNRFELTVTDNGVGRNPGEWSHGLGLGGVRKRVKQLGGQVEWHEVSPRGIGCRVVIRVFNGAV